jgi:hypothetical protein
VRDDGEDAGCFGVGCVVEIEGERSSGGEGGVKGDGDAEGAVDAADEGLGIAAEMKILKAGAGL